MEHDIFQCYGKLGYTRLIADPTVFTMNRSNNVQIIVCIYVDDILMMSSSIDLIFKLKRELSKHFPIKDFGVISLFLGVQFR